MHSEAHDHILLINCGIKHLVFILLYRLKIIYHYIPTMSIGKCENFFLLY